MGLKSASATIPFEKWCYARRVPIAHGAGDPPVIITNAATNRIRPHRGRPIRIGYNYWLATGTGGGQTGGQIA